jgi:hypothetical protein
MAQPRAKPRERCRHRETRDLPGCGRDGQSAHILTMARESSNGGGGQRSWVFQGNPEIYDLEAWLATGQEEYELAGQPVQG